jgi:hypothetical protein
LFDGPFAPAEVGRYLADALLFGETHHDHTPLIGGKRVDMTEQRRALLDSFQFIFAGLTRFYRAHLSCRLRRMIDDLVCRDSVQPCHEGNTTPLERANTRQRIAEHFRGQILGCASISNPARDEGIDALEVRLVERGECGWIFLRRIHQSSLIRIHCSAGYNRDGGEKLR